MAELIDQKSIFGLNENLFGALVDHRSERLAASLPDLHLMDPDVIAILLRWRTVELGAERITANLSPFARACLAAVGIADPDAEEPSAVLQ